MKYKKIGIFEISALTLGTVSLGIPYGVFSGQQQPDTGVAGQLLRAASKYGISSFDTAREYGIAEQLLGTLVADGLSAGTAIVSKFKITADAVTRPALAKQQAFDSVRESLCRLNLGQLPFCLFHMVSGYDPNAVCAVVPGILESLIQEGLIAYGGISLDNLTELKTFAALPAIKVLQVPVNIWDQRLMGDPVWETLAAQEKIIFARSVFLKGLLLQRPEELSGDLKAAAYFIEQLALFAKACDMSVAGFCFSYVRDLPGITSIVFGAETLQQLEENIGLLNGKRIPADVLEKAKACFKGVPENVLIPRSWKL
ncbi:aldo/keto reductase [Niabella drilacis]|uniref:Predicted oxidoreductase n=1 Tax=Niabella drilacis (strain DSM 25811 / CCM 8410 / CCUG 62505 / LMG 26954 / E90) TaxID=1285928 RepID=A0A1G6S3G0_NIADE|nr:aldo/keto reductase [Niabella drilacis]SDD11452.1 Predicted oxidoreductase [Niabella drilacis]